MTEKLLQFIWRLQYFNRQELQTEQGEPLQIIYPGMLNSNQGPDFLEGKIILDAKIWAGNIELHMNTSGWEKHKHHLDNNYNNVILHVVWINDIKQLSRDLPLLELQPRVSAFMLHRYGELMRQKTFIACAGSIGKVPALIWTNWMERLLIERLQRKSIQVMALLHQTAFNWDEVLWRMLARNFGMKVNAEVFEAVAQSIPVRLFSQLSFQVVQIEALLFGQAGLLEKDFHEDYPRRLQQEYRFLQHKYKLQPVTMPVLFLRMRPSNFPTVRLAQLAALMQCSTHLFSLIRESRELGEIEMALDTAPSDYWDHHYHFGRQGPFKSKKLGRDMIRSIIINTAAPLLFCYGNFYHENILIEKATGWLEQLSPERNNISKGWEKTGIRQLHASDSQALLELKTQYCDCKKCLNCAVGNAVLKRLAELPS